MNFNLFKYLFFYLILCFPLAIGISSCSNSIKSNSNPNESFVNEFITPITAVAALGQLSPAGEIRELAAPISQFGSSPRISKLLVKEGDFVKKGDTLAIFENREKLISHKTEVRENTAQVDKVASRARREKRE